MKTDKAVEYLYRELLRIIIHHNKREDHLTIQYNQRMVALK